MEEDGQERDPWEFEPKSCVERLRQGRTTTQAGWLSGFSVPNVMSTQTAKTYPSVRRRARRMESASPKAATRGKRTRSPAAGRRASERRP